MIHFFWLSLWLHMQTLQPVVAFIHQGETYFVIYTNGLLVRKKVPETSQLAFEQTFVNSEYVKKLPLIELLTIPSPIFDTHPDSVTGLFIFGEGFNGKYLVHSRWFNEAKAQKNQNPWLRENGKIASELLEIYESVYQIDQNWMGWMPKTVLLQDQSRWIPINSYHLSGFDASLLKQVHVPFPKEELWINSPFE